MRAGVLARMQGSLERILLHDDVPGAVAFVEDQVRRLLSGEAAGQARPGQNYKKMEGLLTFKKNASKP